jgi:DNA gyrase subunit A
MEALSPDGGDVFTVAERGYGKRSAAEEYRLQGRGGQGVINFRTSAKTGRVMAVRQVGEDDEVILISQEGKILRTPVATFRVIGRSTQGVKIMDLEGDDRLVAAAKLVERDDEVAGEEEGEGVVDEPREPGEEPAEPAEAAEPTDDGDDDLVH